MSRGAFLAEYLPLAPREDNWFQCGYSMSLAVGASAEESAGLLDTLADAVGVPLLGEGVRNVDEAWFVDHCNWSSSSGREFYQASTLYSIGQLDAAADNPDSRDYYQNMAKRAWCLFNADDADC